MDVLSCSYDLRFPVFHSPVEVLDPGVFPQSCLSRLCWISDPLFYLLPLQGYCILLIDLYSFLFSLLLPLLFTTAAFCIMYNGVIPIQDRILAVLRKEAYWVCYFLLASVGLLSDSAF
jgi:hypothetical protein